MSQSLREMGRYSEAQTLATLACERYPGVPWTHSELAEIATAQGDLEAASQRWEVRVSAVRILPVPTQLVRK